jgi:phage tail sheath gpL-like
MSSLFRITVTSGASAATVKGRLRLNVTGYAPSVIERVGSYFSTVAGAIHTGRLSIVTTAVQATGTITLSSLANNDTITVNGVVYTAKTSGASGLNQFNLGASDTTAAANFVAKLNADTSTSITDVVTATSALAVITFTSVVPGNVGNAITIAISAHGTASAARLASGAGDTPVVVYNGI